MRLAYLMAAGFALIVGCLLVVLRLSSRDERSSRNNPIEESDEREPKLERSRRASNRDSDLAAFRVALERGDPPLECAKLIGDGYKSWEKINQMVAEIVEDSLVDFLCGMGNELHKNPNISLMYRAFMNRLIASDPWRAIDVIDEIGAPLCDSNTFAALLAVALSGGHEGMVSAIDSKLLKISKWPLGTDWERFFKDMLVDGKSYTDVVNLLSALPDDGRVADFGTLHYFSDLANRRDVPDSDRELIYDFVAKSQRLEKSGILDKMKTEWNLE
jgi:hypothetical protein